MGKLGLAFSLGIMAGPLLGGFVTEKFGDNTTALLASLLSLVSVITVQMFLPKHTKSQVFRRFDWGSSVVHQPETHEIWLGK